jgi:hypothetical protein
MPWGTRTCTSKSKTWNNVIAGVLDGLAAALFPSESDIGVVAAAEECMEVKGKTDSSKMTSREM